MDETIKALKAQGIIKQREDDKFTLRLRIVGGRLNACSLKVIENVAERYGSVHLHLTSRQGVEIPGIVLADLDAARTALADAGLELAAPGNRVRNIVACPGGSCKNSHIDAQAIAQELDKRVGRREGLPHKCKIAITGCPNSCVHTLCNDIGIVGSGRGTCAVFVGGKLGKKPRTADCLPAKVAEGEELYGLVESIIDWYEAHGETKERFGFTLDRLGTGSLVEALDGQG